MNGKFLDGEMLLGLCKSYERAINDGEVPNVNSAWSYLCKNETLKAFREAETILDRKHQELSKGDALSSEELKSLKKEVLAETFIVNSSLVKIPCFKNVQSQGIW